MNRSFLQACSIALLVLLVACDSGTPTWDQYLNQFPEKRVKYEQIEGELSRRQTRYEEVVASFAPQGTLTYTVGVNEFTDWYTEEIRGLTGLQEIPVTSRMNNVRTPLTRNKVGLPTSFDWRDRNAVTSIKNQGSCGSCWTFATAAYAESRLIIAGDYTKNNIDLSEQYLLECTSYSSCGGGYLEYAMESVKECPTENQYPYSPYASYSGICSASGIRTGFDNYNYYSLSDEELISLLMEGPVAISVASSGWSSYTGGVYQCSAGVSVDHAVLLVGFTPNTWIIKNQWGANWGESGYIKIQRGINDCQIGASAHKLTEKMLGLLWVAALLVMVLL